MECGANKRGGKGICRAPGMENGRCRIHGGTNPGAPIKHGRYSLKHRTSLMEKAQEFINAESPGDLTGELALMRALLQDYLDRFPNEQPLSLKDIESLYTMMDGIGRTVERIAKILNQTALTQAEVQVLQARLADIAVKYVDSDRRNQFFSELESLFSNGGSQSTSGETFGSLPA